MKLALPTLLLTSMASLPYAAARVGQKTKAGQQILKLKAQQPVDPLKVHLAPKQTREDAPEENRIISGENADQGEFPFYVKWAGDILCGASLIHEDIILTAAHCNPNIGNEVVIGAYFLQSIDENAETRLIETRSVHPNYDETNFVNDVMVLKIDSPSSLPPIALNDNFDSPTIGEDVIAIGLGETDNDDNTDTNPAILQKVTTQTIAHDECAAEWSFSLVDEDVMLCAGVQEGDKGTCQGDSGGPLLEQRDGNYVQVGITSWGSAPCLVRPNVYTRVSGVKSWIDQMICELSNNPPASCESPGPPPPDPDPTDPPNEIPCEQMTDGSFVCYQQGYPADGFTLDYFCPASASSTADCTACAIVASDGATQCNSCTICSDTVAYDCSNVAEGDCVTQDCNGSCGGGGGGGDEQCVDVPGWYDADGPEYDCTWYTQDGNCQSFGSELENFGYTANEACCVCGGGNI